MRGGKAHVEQTEDMCRCWELVAISKDLKAEGVGSCKSNSISEHRKAILLPDSRGYQLSLTNDLAKAQRRKGGIAGRKGQQEEENGRKRKMPW